MEDLLLALNRIGPPRKGLIPVRWSEPYCDGLHRIAGGNDRLASQARCRPLAAALLQCAAGLFSEAEQEILRLSPR